MTAVMASTPDILTIEPNARVQWGRDTLLVLGAPGQGDERDVTLLRPSYCTLSECDCAEVEFDITRMIGPLEQVIVHDDHLQRVPDMGVVSERLRVRVEVQVGKIVAIWRDDSSIWSSAWYGGTARLSDEARADRSEEGADSGHGLSEERLAWLNELGSAFDGEVLEELWRRHTLARGLDPRRLRRRPPDSYDSGLIAWNEVCLHPRKDVLSATANGEHIVVFELYCANPKCQCKEAHVTFQTSEGSIGEVIVGFETGEFDLAPEPGWPEDQLRSAWEEYVERWPRYRARLDQRYHDLRAALDNYMQRNYMLIEQELEPRRSEGPKIGRNQPCPCGSGRKYKRCCAP